MKSADVAGAIILSLRFTILGLEGGRLLIVRIPIPMCRAGQICAHSRLGGCAPTGSCPICLPAKYGIREGVDKAIKQYIYSKKDTIIDRVVEREQPLKLLRRVYPSC